MRFWVSFMAISDSVFRVSNAYPNPNAAHINFAGALIGNGCINWTVQTPESFVDFQLAHNLIPAGPVPPAFNNDTNAWMDAYIGYTPNFYDYRLQNLDCVGCYGFVGRV